MRRSRLPGPRARYVASGRGESDLLARHDAWERSSRSRFPRAWSAMDDLQALISRMDDATGYIPGDPTTRDDRAEMLDRLRLLVLDLVRAGSEITPGSEEIVREALAEVAADVVVADPGEVTR